MFTNIKSDFKALCAGTGNQIKAPFKPTRILFVLCSFEFWVVLSFRFYSYLYTFQLLKLLGLLLYCVVKIIMKVDIHPSARIGPGLNIVHGFNIVIGGAVVIGANLVIFDSVTIGKKNVGTNQGMAKIGNDVLLGTGCKLLGEIEIGDDSSVGANAVVLSSFPNKSTLVGVPARNINETE